MVDWMNVAKLAVIALGVFMLLQIASQPGIWGKVFVIAMVALLYYFYERMNKQSLAPNHLNTYHDRLKRLAKLKGPGGLRMLKMMGDAANGWYLKGRILGGPVYEINKNLPLDSPKRNKLIFLYTPDTGWAYTLPVVSWIMVNFRREILFSVFHNPKAKPPVSQLKNKIQMMSADPLDASAKMIGDLEVRGINTYFVREMEYVNDELFDHDAEMKRLEEHVDRLTLEDNLERLPERIRKAVDSNSRHVRDLDLKDYIAGTAKEGDAA